MNPSRSRYYPWLIPLVAFALAISSAGLFRSLAAPFATIAWKLFWVVVCFGALWFARGVALKEALQKLGLFGPAGTGLGWTLLASLPMLLILPLASKGHIAITAERLFMGVLIGPAAEEVLFRGYLFRQLYRRAEWGLVTSVLVTAVVFGLLHLRNLISGGNWTEMLLQVGITSAGGAFFAWLFVRWGDNLWVPIGMHTFMNFWWELFGVGATAVGSRSANVAPLAAVATAIVLTFWKTKRIPGGAPKPAVSRDAS